MLTPPCNGCSSWSRCRFNKFRYSPEDAHLDYRSTLVDARRGVNLTVQEAISMASLIAPLLSHVDSAPVELLGGKSPLELTDFMYHDLYEKLYAFGIRPIDKDQVILKPYLLKK